MWNKAILNFGKGIFRVARMYSEEIFTGIALIGTMAQPFLSARAYAKTAEPAKDILNDEELTKKEKAVKIARTCGPSWIPTIATMIITGGSIIAGNHVGSKKQAALMGLISASELAHAKYQQQVLEAIGPEKVREIEQELNQKRVSESYPAVRETVFVKTGETLIYDVTSGKYFSSTKQAVENCANEINRRCMLDIWITLNEAFDILGIENTKIGDMVGFNIDHPMEIKWGTTEADNGEPCFTMEYEVVLFK